MTYFNLDVGDDKRVKDEARDAKRGKFEHLAARLGKAARRELHLPMCATCSTQTSYSGSDLDLQSSDSDYKCKICLDPRQFIGPTGQKWTNLEKLIKDGSNPLHNEFKEVIPGSLWTFRIQPTFGIGQRAFLIKHANIPGLIMWDCVAYLDDATLDKIDELSHGQGISHMIISHPHYYSTTATWTAAFPMMKMWLAKEDFYNWYQREDIVTACKKGISHDDIDVVNRIKLIDEEQTLLQEDCNVKILLLGGHFPGSLVLLWNDILFLADTIQIVPSGMYRSDQPQREAVASVTFLWR